MPQKFRTFIAVEIAPAVRRAAAELIDQLAPLSDGVKWVAPHNMHLTLKFLGDVDEADIPRVCAAAGNAARAAAPYALRIAGVGAFPSLRRPRTIWAGAHEGGPQTIELAKQIDRAMRTLGFPKEARPLTPHLTLGRVRQAGPGLAALSEALADREEYDFGPSPVDAVIVFSSQLGREGPTYTPLSACQLGGAE